MYLCGKITAPHAGLAYTILLCVSFVCLQIFLETKKKKKKDLTGKALASCGSSLMALFHCMVWHDTFRYSSLLGGIPLGTVPGTFLVPLRPWFQAIRTVTKT